MSRGRGGVCEAFSTALKDENPRTGRRGRGEADQPVWRREWFSANRMVAAPKAARSASRSVDGSGIGAGLLLPTESSIAGPARPSLAVVAVLKLAELMSGAPNERLGVNVTVHGSGRLREVGLAAAFNAGATRHLALRWTSGPILDSEKRSDFEIRGTPGGTLVKKDAPADGAGAGGVGFGRSVFRRRYGDDCAASNLGPSQRRWRQSRRLTVLVCRAQTARTTLSHGGLQVRSPH